MENNKPKNLMWAITVENYLEVYELAKKHGKKEGDNMEEEFLEIMKNKPEKCLGTTNLDKEDLKIHLEAEGKNILDINDLQRKKL